MPNAADHEDEDGRPEDSHQARARPLLYALTVRSVLVIASAIAVGVWVDDVSPPVAGAAFAAAGMISVGWTAATASDRARRLLEDVSEWPGAAQPKVRSTPETVALVLLRLPFGVAVLWGLSQLSRLTAGDPDVFVGALSGLLAGLAYTRLRLAQAIRGWEDRHGRTLLVGGLTVRGSDLTWVAPPDETPVSSEPVTQAEERS